MHPILLELPGGAPLRTYGVLVALGLLVGWITSLANAKARGLDVEKLGIAYVLAAVAALIGARGLWVAQHPGAYEGPLSLVRISAGEMALGGGLLAGAVATWAYCRREELPLRSWLDCLAAPLLIAFGLERLGAFLAGTDFGLYAPDFPLSLRYPTGSPAHLFHLQTMRGAVLPNGSSLPVHPAPLYGLALAVAGGAWIRWRARAPRYVGESAVIALASFVTAKMLVEPAVLAERDGLELGGVQLDLVAGVFYLVLLFALHRRGLRSPGDG